MTRTGESVSPGARVGQHGCDPRLESMRGSADRMAMLRGLLRERFGGSDHIFDLALLESTRPDGSRAYSRYFGDKAFMLAPEWTDDGGHLNEAAQYHVAERLLVFLATLDPSSTDRLSTAGSRNDESLTLPISTNGDLADDQR